jgi:hypothetical protein
VTAGRSTSQLSLAAAIVLLVRSRRPITLMLNRVAHRVLPVMAVVTSAVVPGGLVITLTPVGLVALVPNHRRRSMARIIGTVVLVMAGWIGVVAILSIIAMIMRPVIAVAGVLMHGTAAQQDQPEEQHEKT